MAPLLVPEDPRFTTESEHAVWAQLRDTLAPRDTLIANHRLTDSAKDHEADLVIVMPDVGVTVVEVKGAGLSNRDGHWYMRRDGEDRRIDPVAQARAFEAEGAPWIHVVDLDAARTGEPVNRAVVAAIAAGVSVPVQSGGGVRDEDAAEALFAAGVARVVVGTAALEDPQFVRRLAARHPVAVGLDARGRDVAVRGWLEGSGSDLLDLASAFEDAGVAALVVSNHGGRTLDTAPATAHALAHIADAVQGALPLLVLELGLADRHLERHVPQARRVGGVHLTTCQVAEEHPLACPP